MKIPNKPLTRKELNNAIDRFVSNFRKSGKHKKCGGVLRKGFFNLFSVDKNGAVDPGHDGFGLGPVAVPYCDACDPPDGFNYTYATRVLIKN